MRWRAQERQVLLWPYEHSNRSDWLLGCVSAFGNRCDSFKQVVITGMSGIAPLYRTLNVLSLGGKLSLDHMLPSHITLKLWHPASHQRPMQPLPNPLSDHQLSCPIWVSPLPQPSFSYPSNAPLLGFLEWKWISHARCAAGGRWWKSMQGEKKSCFVFFSMHPHVNKKGQRFSFLSVRYDASLRPEWNYTKEIPKVLFLTPLPKKTAC